MQEENIFLLSVKLWLLALNFHLILEQNLFRFENSFARLAIECILIHDIEKVVFTYGFEIP